MIVDEPPFDLVALLSDADLYRLMQGLVERGQERGCIRRIRWYPIRDASRDALCKRPEGILRAFFGEQRRFLIAWDHEGSGREGMDPSEVEAEVVELLVRSGVPADHVLAVAQSPELEVVFSPVWDNVKRRMARKRGMLPPSDESVLAQLSAVGVSERISDIVDALARYPKETFQALLRVLHLRHSAAIYEGLGAELSIPRMKAPNSTVERVSTTLVKWFPPQIEEAAEE